MEMLYDGGFFVSDTTFIVFMDAQVEALSLRNSSKFFRTKISLKECDAGKANRGNFSLKISE